MWTLTLEQVGTIVIVAMLAGAVLQWAGRWILDASQRRVDRMIDEGRAAIERDGTPVVIGFDGTLDDDTAVVLMDRLRQPRPRPIIEMIDEITARMALPDVQLPEPLTIRNRQEAAKRVRQLIDDGRVHIDHDAVKDPLPLDDFQRAWLDRWMVTDPRPRRLSDTSAYAEGGVIPPLRFSDKEPIVLSEGRLLDDPDEMDALGLTADARRYRLEPPIIDPLLPNDVFELRHADGRMHRFTVCDDGTVNPKWDAYDAEFPPDSDSTTPPTEGNTAP